MYTFNIESISGETITYKSENDNITVNQLKEEISKLSPYKYNNLDIYDNGKQLIDSEKVEYTNTTLNFIISEKQPFLTKKELKDAIARYKSNNIIKKQIDFLKSNFLLRC